MPNKHELLLVNEFHPETVEVLDSLYQTHHLWKIPREQRSQLIRDIDGSCRAAATASWNCDELVYTLNSLEMLSCFGVGVDGIAFDITNSQGIKVSNTPEVLDDAVADVALTLILSTLRNVVNADRFVRSGAWGKGPLAFGQSLAGRTLGIIGLGRIGEAIAHRALPFKMKIAYHNRTRKKLPYTYHQSIEELARNSDVLLCMLPGGEATKKIINKKAFENLGPDGIFINVGRGSSVDENDLVEALHCGKIAGAGLDVYANEPHVPEALLTMDQVVLLPHIGSATVETRRAMGNLVIKNLEAFFNDQPILTPIDHS